MGIEYTRYLRQVIDALEKDETFKKKLENAKEHDIKVSTAYLSLTNWLLEITNQIFCADS